MAIWLKEHVVFDILFPKGLPYKRFTEVLKERGVPYDVINRTIHKHLDTGFMTAERGRFVIKDVDAETRRNAAIIMKVLDDRKFVPKNQAKGILDCIERGLRKINQMEYTKKEETADE